MQPTVFEILLDKVDSLGVTITTAEQSYFFNNFNFLDWSMDGALGYETPSIWDNAQFSPTLQLDYTIDNINQFFWFMQPQEMGTLVSYPGNPNYVPATLFNAYSGFYRVTDWDIQMFSVPNNGLQYGEDYATLGSEVEWTWDYALDYPYINSTIFTSLQYNNSSSILFPFLSYYNMINPVIKTRRADDDFENYPSFSPLALTGLGQSYPLGQSDDYMWTYNDKVSQTYTLKLYNQFNRNIDGTHYDSYDYVSKQRIESRQGYITTDGSDYFYQYKNVDSIASRFNNQDWYQGSGFSAANFYYGNDVSVAGRQLSTTPLGDAVFWKQYNSTVLGIEKIFNNPTDIAALTTAAIPHYEWVTFDLSLNFYKDSQNGAQWSPTDLSPNTLLNGWNQYAWGGNDTPIGIGASYDSQTFYGMTNLVGGEVDLISANVVFNSNTFQIQSHPSQNNPNYSRVIRMDIPIDFGVTYHFYSKISNSINGGKIYFTQSSNINWHEAVASEGTQVKEYFNLPFGTSQEVQFDFTPVISEINIANLTIPIQYGCIIIVCEGNGIDEFKEIKIEEVALDWRVGMQSKHTWDYMNSSGTLGAYGSDNFNMDGEQWIGRTSNHKLVVTTNKLAKGRIDSHWFNITDEEHEVNNHNDYDQSSDENITFTSDSFGVLNNYIELNDSRDWCNQYSEPVNEDVYTKFLYPSSLQPKDSKGFYRNQFIKKTITIAIASPDLHLYADTINLTTPSNEEHSLGLGGVTSYIPALDTDGSTLLSHQSESGAEAISNFKLGEIEFHTCQDSHITRDLAGGYAVRLYSNPLVTKTPPSKMTKVMNDVSGFVDIKITIDSWDYASSEAQTAETIDDLHFVATSGSLSTSYVIPRTYYNLDVNGEGTVSLLSYFEAEAESSISLKLSGLTGYGADVVISEIEFTQEDQALINLVHMEALDNSASPYLSGVRVFGILGYWWESFGVNGFVVSETWSPSEWFLAESLEGQPSLTYLLTEGLSSDDINDLMSSESIDIEIATQDIDSATTITVVDTITGVEEEALITSSSPTTTNITRVPSGESIGSITLKFSHSSDGSVLNAVVNSVILKANVATSYYGYSSNRYSLDLYEGGNEFALTLNSKNFEDLDSINGDYTKTITVPATKNNTTIFNNQNEIAAVFNKAYFFGVPCKAFQQGVNVFKGKAFLDSVELDEYGKKNYNLLLRGGNNNWAALLDKEPKFLRNIMQNKPNHYVHLKLDDIQYQGWQGASDIVFPLVDSGMWHDTNWGEWDEYEEHLSVTLNHLKPSYRIARVFDEIFKSIGWTWQSKVLNENQEFSTFGNEFNNEFHQLIGTKGQPKVHEDDINDSLMLMGSVEPQTVRANPIYGNNHESRMIRIPREVPIEGNEAMAVWSTYRALNLETEYRDDNNTHYTRDVVAGDYHVWGSDGGTFGSSAPLSGQTSGYMYILFNDDTEVINSIGSKSIIKVDKTGYYRVNSNVEATFYMPQGTGLAYAQSETRFGAIGLHPLRGNQDPTYSSNGLGTLNFSKTISTNDSNQNAYTNVPPFDETINLDGEEVYARDVSLNLGYDQYLKAGVEYLVVWFDGFHMVSFSQGVYSNGFSTVNSIQLEVKLSDSIYPLFNYGLIYNLSNLDATPKVGWEHLLPDVKPIEFIAEVSKLYNLIWQSNPITKSTECDPFLDFYDWEGDVHKFYDWNKKATIKTIIKDSLLATDLRYLMKDDSSDASLNKGQTSESLTFGDVRFLSDRNKAKDNKDVSLSVFSTCKMAWEKELLYVDDGGSVHRGSVYIPRIYTEDTVAHLRNHKKPEENMSHGHKLLRFLGNKNTGGFNIIYNIKRSPNGNDTNNYYVNEFSGMYGKAVSYLTNNEIAPLTFSGASSFSPESGGGFYHRFHQAQIEMFKTRDEIVVAEVHLTPTDIHSLNYRRLVVIGNNRYIINKIVDYKPQSSDPTEVELILVSNRGSKEKLIQ
jgi:hypothetical protein